MRLCAPLIVALILWALPAAAQPGPNPFLAQARVFYQGLEFERCIQRLEQAVQRESTKEEQAEIELYAGLCHYHLADEKTAKERFARAVALDAGIALPPFTSPKIVAVFDEVRAKVSPPSPSHPDAPKQAALTPEPGTTSKASREWTATDAPRRSDVAPLSLAGAAALATGASVLFGTQARTLASEANSAHFESDAYRLGQQARQRALFANVGIGVAVAAASGALVTWLFSPEPASAQTP